MKRRVIIALLVMGFSGLVAEVLLLQELLAVFSGNELSIGIIMANWLILEALGSLLLGRWAASSGHRLEAFAGLTALFSMSLPMAVRLTRSLKGLMGVSIGESIGLLPMFTGSLIVLLPVSLLHGALFTLGCRIYAAASGEDTTSAGRVYVYETVGTIAGGVVSTYLLIPYVTTFEAAAGLMILTCLASLALLIPYRQGGPVRASVLAGLSLLLVLTVGLLSTGRVERLHQQAVRAQWRHQNVVHTQNSRYGTITVTENQGQYTFFLDGLPAMMTPIPDIPSVEEFVHLPLLAHHEPTSILILSGGAGGVIHEVLKHPSIERVEYAEPDPLLLSLLRAFPTPLTESELNDARVEVRHIDGRLLLKTTPDTYDLIFMGIKEPATLQTNRFFTREFFSLAAERLNEGGILVLGAPGSLSFRNEELRDLNSVVFHTLSSVFTHLRVLPGDSSHLFLASNSPGITRMDVAEVMDSLIERGIEAEVMVPRHIENKLHEGWQGWFAGLIEGGMQRVNRDFRPLGLFTYLAYWNSLHAPRLGRLFGQLARINLGVAVLLPALGLLTYRVLRSRAPMPLSSDLSICIATTGFAGMTFSLVLIFAYQTVYGYVFSWIGLLVAAFMAGAAGGARLMTSPPARRRHSLALFRKLELAIVALAVGLPVVLAVVHTAATHESAFALLRVVFLVLATACGLVVGAQFPLANRLVLEEGIDPDRAAARLYAADLVGGWLGGMVSAVVLLPVLGLAGTCATLALLNLASYVIAAGQPGVAAGRR